MWKALCLLAASSLVFGSPGLGAESLATLFVPIAAHLPAANGETWASDLRLYNPSQEDVSVGLTFLSDGKDNSAASEVSVTVGAGRALLLDDVVSKTFGLMGSGAIRIRSSVSLVASSSTYLAAPFVFPGVTAPRKETFQTPAADETEWSSSASRVLSVANRFRDIEAGPSVRDSYTNVGLLNPSPDTIFLALTLIDEARFAPLGTKTVSLPPYGFAQIVDLFDAFGVSNVRLENAVLSIGAAKGPPLAFQPAPVLAYAVRQTSTFDSCGGFSKQADFLFAQRIP
jgi:hypothetical protein